MFEIHAYYHSQLPFVDGGYDQYLETAREFVIAKATELTSQWPRHLAEQLLGTLRLHLAGRWHHWRAHVMECQRQQQSPTAETTAPSSEGATVAPNTLRPKRKSVSEWLDEARLKEDISHEEQADRIKISRTTYFEVKAGRGGRTARRKTEIYLSSLFTSDYPNNPD